MVPVAINGSDCFGNVGNLPTGAAKFRNELPAHRMEVEHVAVVVLVHESIRLFPMLAFRVVVGFVDLSCESVGQNMEYSFTNTTNTGQTYCGLAYGDCEPK